MKRYNLGGLEAVSYSCLEAEGEEMCKMAEAVV